MLKAFPGRAPSTGALLLFCTLYTALAVAAEPASPGEAAWVATVLDGDTVILGDGRHVRLIGINIPERARDERPAEPFAEEATALLNDLVGRRPVRLLHEQEARDRYQRLLAHLLLPNGRNVQEILLEQGLASAIAIPPNLDYLDRYLAAERRARVVRIGIWAHPYFAPVVAGEINKAQVGFRFVRGRIRRVGKGKRFFYLDLTRYFSLRVSREEWSKYWEGTPEDWLDANVQARGWITAYRGKLRMRVRHPAMLERME